MKIMPTLPAGKFYTSVSSPPYWGLRDYGISPTDWPEITYTPMPGLPPVTVPEWTGCLGLEPTPIMFVAHVVAVYREVRRVLRDDGTIWINFGDCYATAANSGIKIKDLVGQAWRVAFALQADGWYLRSDVIWAKTNPMPESVSDRPTKAHEYIFLLSKSPRYYYDAEAIKEPGVQDEWANGFRGGSYVHGETYDNQSGGHRKQSGNFRIPTGWDTEVGSHGTIHRKGRSKSHSFARAVSESPPPGQASQHRPEREDINYNGMRNKRSVWPVATQPFPEAHFATFPEKLIEPCILAGAPVGGEVLDPFGGSGTTYKVAIEQGRVPTIIEIGPQYVEIAECRTATLQPVMQFQ